MNYYKRGDAANADKIRAAFEKLGYDTSFVQKLSASDSHILFTLPCNTRVHAFHTAYIEADILKRLVNIDPDYKELELPVEPKFKVGDKVIYNGKQHTVTFVNDKYYGFSGGVAGCLIELQDQLLSPAPKPHYDIANFYAGMPVLVREYDTCVWQWVLYSHFNGVGLFFAAGKTWRQCIPFEGNETLLGTTDMCNERFINW